MHAAKRELLRQGTKIIAAKGVVAVIAGELGEKMMTLQLAQRGSESTIT